MNILESRNIRLLGHSDLKGHGDGMQIMKKGDYLFVGHMGYTGMGTSVLDVSNPADPQVVKQITIPENTHSHKVQLAGDILLVNHEQQLHAGAPYSAGLAVYDISSPANPKQIGFMPIKGEGVHRMWWVGGKYAYMSIREEGYLHRFMATVDVSDPENPRIHSRWWYPGQWIAGGEVPTWEEGPTLRAHHVIVKGDRAYGGYGNAGMVIFAVDDGHLELISECSWFEEVGGNTQTHTALPLLSRNIAVVTDESLRDNCQEAKKDVRVFDIRDDRNPQQLGMFPIPEGDYCERGGRFGPHNVHENRPEPDSFVSEDIIFVTYFNAGLRVYDVRDPVSVKEIASFVPDAPAGQPAIQLNDVYVDSERRIYVTDRLKGGLFILEMTNGS